MGTVVIAGGTGLVGSHLQRLLIEKGYRVLVLTRKTRTKKSKGHFIRWDVENGMVDDQALEADYVINLSGAGIADKKWNRSRKKAIMISRIQTTDLLINHFKKKQTKLKSFINASAMGYYGDCGDTIMKEDELPCDSDFLSNVCVKWEESAAPATKVADSVTILRISTVLSTKGGALPKMIQSIPLGIAPYFGSGNQYMSWIHIEDLCRLFVHFLGAKHRYEIFNASTDTPVTNKDFVHSLTSVIRPSALVVPTPSIALRLAMGEMSKLVLNSCRLSAHKTLNTGFEFEYDDVSMAVADLRSRNI